MIILLAEDDQDIAKIASLALKEIGGHEIITCNNGEECLKTLENVKPDLVLLDVMMPKLNGFEVCKKIKQSKHKNIPIIFLSAKSQSNEIQNGMNLGAIGYILKPFDPLTLSQQIEEILKHDKLKVS
jgi:DNA-binding response OmpR family regulator